MKINSDFKDLLSSLNRSSAEYLLVGGFAVILHSEPRYTKDLDIWVKASEDNAAKVYKALLEFGAPLAQLGISAEDFQKEGYFVQFGREPARIDILMGLKGLTFEEAYKNKLLMQLGDIEVAVISRSDLINVKLQAGRPQDLIDAAALKKSEKAVSKSGIQ